MLSNGTAMVDDILAADIGTAERLSRRAGGAKAAGQRLVSPHPSTARPSPLCGMRSLPSLCRGAPSFFPRRCQSFI